LPQIVFGLDGFVILLLKKYWNDKYFCRVLQDGHRQKKRHPKVALRGAETDQAALIADSGMPQ
jgi:hypothetical protein